MRGSCRGLICVQGAPWGPVSAQPRTLLGLAGQSWRQEEDTRAGGELAPEERRGPLHSPECWPRGAHSFLAGKLQEKTSWACLSPGPARLGSPLTPWRHQGGHRGCWKAKENLKDGARPEGNPPPPPSTSPVGKDASLKARARGKAEQDPPLKLLGQSQASRI